MMLLLLAVSTVCQAQVKRTYTVRAGDTLYRIALNHNLPVEELQRLNGLEGTVIRVGQVLRLTQWLPEDSTASGAAVESALPVTPPLPEEANVPPGEEVPPVGAPRAEEEAESASPESFEPVPPAPIRAVTDSTGHVLYGEYTLGAGQSYYDVAFTIGLPVDSLEVMNAGMPIIPEAGTTVRVPARYASSTHTVAAGETLYGIAASHGVSLAELRLANPDLGQVIYVGQELSVPSAPAEPTLPLVIAEGPASVYPSQFQGRLMASGRPYDAARFTLAHPALPFGSVVMVENPETGASTFAEVADRMPVSTDFVVEVSRAVADAIGLSEAAVRVRIIESGAR